MNTIRVSASRAYNILLEKGLFAQAGGLIRGQLGAPSGARAKESAEDPSAIERRSTLRAMIVSDDRVFQLYGEQLQQGLENAGIATHTYLFPHGERSKNLIIYADLMETLCTEQFTRSDILVALGGGVVGDLAGFAAATYQRGIRFVQIPTTVLACVDSSVGGKTAVNLSGGKNQVGSFYQPSLVLIDPELLTTLSGQEYANGCAEVIKYGVIGDRELFDDLKQQEDGKITEDMIGTCVRNKRNIVERDEFDTGERMLLNFGHTFGHAVEHCSNYTVPHGFAVAMGMVAMTRAAEARAICEKGAAAELVALLKQFGLPTEIPFSAKEIAEAVLMDKKRSGGILHLVVPEKIGRCVIKEISAEEVGAWLVDGGVA